MNNSPLDEHIKKTFGAYSPDVPPHIWENIVAEKDKRRPAGFWFSSLNRSLVVLLLAVVITTSGIFIYKNTSTTSTAGKGVVNEAAKSTAKEAGNISTNPQAENINNKDIASTAVKNDQLTEPTNSNSNNNSITADNSTKNKRTGNSNNKNNLTSSTAKTNNSISHNTSSNTKNKKGSRTKGSALISFADPAVGTEESDNVKNSSNELLMERYLLSLDILRSEKDLSTSIKQSKNPHLDIPCPDAEKNAAGNKRYFEIYAGPDYAFRSMSDTGSSAYLQKRKESTSFSSAFSAGIRYTRVFGNGMSFRTGLNYSQINEKFKYIEGNIVQVVYVIDTNGDTTGSYTTTGTRYKTTYNRFRTLDIPILIGYELGNGRWHANINAGAVVNLYSWQKGDVLDTAYKPINITTGKSSSPYQFKTNVGIGFMGAVSVYYKINDRLHLLAEPYFRYSFSPASKSQLTLKQKYNTAGIRLGVRLDF